MKLEFKSLIIVIVGFKNCVCCLVWAVDLGVQITVVGRSLYIGSFCPAMTSLSRYLEEEAFSISICYNNERPTEQKQPTVRWKDGGK